MNAVDRIAWNLRFLRVAKGISQESLAVDAAVDRTHVSRLERGIENPSINLIERLATALDADIVDLLALPEPGAESPAPLPGGRKSKG